MKIPSDTDSFEYCTRERTKLKDTICIPPSCHKCVFNVVNHYQANKLMWLIEGLDEG